MNVPLFILLLWNVKGSPKSVQFILLETSGVSYIIHEQYCDNCNVPTCWSNEAILSHAEENKGEITTGGVGEFQEGEQFKLCGSGLATKDENVQQITVIM